MKAVKLLKPYFIEKRRFILAGVVCLIVVDFLQLFIPRVIKWAVDDLTALGADHFRLMIYALYIVGIAFAMGIFRYVWRRCLIGASRRVEEGLRNRLFFHIQTLSANFYNKTTAGDLMAHATNDVQNIRMAVGMGVVALTDAVVLGIAAIGFMAYINVRLTLYVIIPMPLIIFGTRFFSKKMHRLYGEVQGAFSDLTETVRERYAGVRIIKAFNREDHETEKVKAISKAYVAKNISLVRITGAFFPMMQLFSNVSLVVVLLLGGRQTILQTITPGDFVAFISYLGLLTWPMMATGWVTNLIQRGRASLGRINAILETRPEIESPVDAISVQNFKGRVVFDKVSFSYASSPDTAPANEIRSRSLQALSDISFHLAPGKVLGIIGPPGSGKTTLLNLIPRLFDATAGRISIDGYAIRDLDLSDLRSHILFMPQEPFIFAGSIRENMTFSRPAAGDDADLIRAAKQAAFYETIQKLPEGFDTLIGEKGVTLSGGQKQRLALARSLMQGGGLWILDDPISQVDVETGREIIRTITAAGGKRNIIIVSHRLSAVRHADLILVLDNGRIAASGTHDSLMARDSYYAKTFQLQQIEEELHAG